jgi:surfeit locus 1 family protein
MLARFRQAGLILPLIMTLVAVPALIGLGHWQMVRKAWKEDLIAKLAARPKAEPVSLMEAIRRFHENGDVEYLRVRATGTFDHTSERHLFAPANAGLGWEVYAILRTDDGPVYVNRGWVPDALEDPAKRAQGQIVAEATVTGLVRLPEAKGTFTPQDDPKGNRWYRRDAAQMAGAAGNGKLPPVLPFTIDTEAEPANPGGWPKGGTTFTALPNNHFEYALTWYGFAITSILIFLIFARGRLAALPK